MQEKEEEKAILKLEKEIENFEKELNIETKERDIIKDYKMKEGDYQILITIYEANELMPRGTDFFLFKTDKSACDSFVEIEIGDQVQKTTVKKDTNNPIFDEKFYFKFQGMTLEKLDRSTISFKLYDKKRFILNNSLIGSFELDWTNAYFKRNHEIYRGWLTLMDPLDDEEGIMGYLLVSVAVLGENDKVTVHDSAFIKDPLTTIEDTITMPKLQLIDYGINIEIYRAENLVPLDEFAGNVDAYVIAKFSGNKMDTSVKTSCNPQWDELIRLGTAVPTKSKYITLEVRNRNFVIGDDLIGTLKIPFVDLKEESEPVWGHLYGPPVSGKDYAPYNFATKMQIYGAEMGSHYRGRILYKITGHKDVINRNSRKQINFKFPFKPTPVVPLKSYTLRLELLDGFNLPEIQGKSQCFIHCCIGQYMIVSRSFGELRGKSITFMERLVDKKAQLPEDHSQVPDIIIYLAKGEKERDRISYIRIPAKSIISSTISNPMTIYSLKTDLTLNNFKKDESGGCITARLHLFTGQPPETKSSLLYEFGKKTQFLVKIFLYRAKNLPPMNESGDCDPKLVFSLCGAETKAISDSTYNPIWNEILNLNIETEDFMSTDIEKALICNVFDIEQNGKDNLIGNFMVKLSKKKMRKYMGCNRKINFIYQKPEWYPITNEKVDIGDPCFGHVLIGCAVFRKDDIGEVEHRSIKMIKELSEKKSFQLFLLGARDLEPMNNSHLDNKAIFFEVKIGKNLHQASKAVLVRTNSANLNQMLLFDIEVPKNKTIIPYVDIKVFEQKSGLKKFIGFTSISLYDLVPKIIENSHTLIAEEEGEEPSHFSEETVIDLDELERQLDVVRERKRKKMEALLKDENQEKLKKDLLNIEEMQVPKELGSTDDGNESEKNKKLEDLLNKFEEEYETDPQYNYISNLEKEKDLNDKENANKNEKNKAEDESKSLNSIYDDDEEQHLNYENTSKPFRGFKKTMKFQEEEALSEEDDGREKVNRKSHRQSRFGEKSLAQKQYNMSETSIKQDFMELANRFEYNSDAKRSKKELILPIKVELETEKTISNFDMDANEEIKQVEHDERAIKFSDLERIILEEEKFTKEAMERQENYKYAAAVKLSLFKWKQEKKNTERETYQDYDTDPDETLDIIPEWYKGRKILATDFEELVPNKKIRSLPIYQGGNRIANLDIRHKKVIGHLKCIGLAVNEDQREKKEKEYLKLLKPRSYVCRIYVLKGKSLISSSSSSKPTTYLKFSHNEEIYNLQETTKCENDYNPEYYVCQEIPMDVPGASNVRIDVIEITSSFGIKRHNILGYTEIDIEERHFTKKWHLFTEKKPIELRNLYSEYGNGTQGRLEVWVDIIEKKNWLTNPPFRIHPPPFDKFELRVIVWSTKECVYKNEAFQSNDIYVRGMLGTSEGQETDTHWACRSVGNFNYRFKYEVSYPPKPEDMYSDQFVVQIWDRDVVGYNNLIGEKRINLNKIHRIIEKAVKRKKSVKAKMKIREKGLALTEKFWFDVYNHKVKDEFGNLESQGKVQLSFELIPKTMADENYENGYGRAEPNVFPTLPEPAGRLNFNILHPLDFCKQLCGPDLYKSICCKMLCCLVLVVIGVLVYFVFGQVIAKAIVG